jgi:transposase
VKRAFLEREKDIEELRRIALALNASNAQLLAQLRKKCSELEKLKGSKDELQQTLALIDTLTATTDKPPAAPSSPDGPAPAPRPPKPPVRTGPTPQPRLPVVELHCTLDEADKACPSCGGGLRPMTGQFEESEMVDVVDVQYRVVKVKRQKYVCRCGSCVETALGPQRAAPGSRYSLALAVKTAVDKYAHQLPLARQVVIAAECGFEVTTQTLWDLVYRIGSLLSPTAQELLIRLLQRDVIGLDQTSWPRLDVAGQKPWQMWALTAGGPISGQQDSLPAIAVHRICDDKGAATFLDLVGPYSGVIVCDAATAHGSGARDAPGTIILAGCWAHVMRRFKEAAQNFPAAADACDMIRELYDIDAKSTSVAQRAQLRHSESRALCERLLAWLQANTGPTVLSIHEAVNYTLKIWSRLTVFLDNPQVPLDNNTTERAFRRPVIGRNNYFGAKSRSGTNVAATFFSLLETCRLHDVNFADYLTAACIAAERGSVLLPWDFKPAA